ncbi:MAG: DUF1501 domain-containing protein [Pirellulales bacterium]
MWSRSSVHSALLRWQSQPCQLGLRRPGKSHNFHAGNTDQPIAALIKNLKQPGLLDGALIVWGGSGRQPTYSGRDWPGSQLLWLYHVDGRRWHEVPASVKPTSFGDGRQRAFPREALARHDPQSNGY